MYRPEDCRIHKSPAVAGFRLYKNLKCFPAYDAQRQHVRRLSDVLILCAQVNIATITTCEYKGNSNKSTLGKNCREIVLMDFYCIGYMFLSF